MIELRYLKLNQLGKIDEIIYHLEDLQRDLLRGCAYGLPNRQDIVDFINKTKGPIDD